MVLSKGADSSGKGKGGAVLSVSEVMRQWQAGCQIATVTGAPSHPRGGPCLDQSRVMTLTANGLFTVTLRPVYKYCKFLKAASKQRLDVHMQETHVNGLVEWHV